MKCIKCNNEMELEEKDLDSPYTRTALYVCECGISANAVWFGSQEEPDVDWFDEDGNEI